MSDANRRRARPVPSPAVARIDNSARKRVRRDWRWRSFPVVAAFVFGALIASFLDRPDTDFAVGVRIALVIAAGACLAHIMVAYVIAPRRFGGDSRDGAEEAAYEDELVYEEE